MEKFLMLSLCVYLIFMMMNKDENLLVEIEQGTLSGKSGLDRKNVIYYSFLSIPYAKPPIGKLRFKAPEAPEPWTGVRDATIDLPQCAQKSIFFKDDNYGQEDCLFLNVHTPGVHIGENESLMPVMVYIHGGGYIEGSGNAIMYGADFIMGHEVVLVTINYRLGIFGFISSSDETLGVHGNVGFKDQNMALKWVQKNIKKFGGNPNKVTIFGQSAGGGSVHHHVLSPMSKGLFHNAISMSGNALGAWNHGIKGSLEIQANLLNISTHDKVKMLEEMQALPFKTILESETKSLLIIPINEAFPYSPIVETQKNSEVFLPAKPIDIIKSGIYNHVPFMIGYTNIDGLLFELIPRLFTGKPLFFDDLKLAIPYDLKLSPEESKLLQNKIKDHYFGGEAHSESNLREFTDLATDLWFTSSIDRLIHEHLKHNDNLYLYKFTADTKLNYFKNLEPNAAKIPGACHCDDLGYLFNTAFTPNKIEKDSVEDKGIKNMVTLWTNFAKYGVPTIPHSEVQWLPVSKDKLNYYEIATNSLTLEVNPDKERTQFWRDAYNKYGNIKHDEL